MENNFGKRLKELRVETKISEKELAEVLKIQKTTLRNWESGMTTPNLNKLILICNFFNVRLNYLVGLDDTRQEE